MKKSGMGTHESTKIISDSWMTPEFIMKALGNNFDLDPCTPEEGMPWKTANKYYTKKDDGLKQPWFGKVWLNPPYGNETKLWMKKLKEHNNGIALIFARTETASFFENVWDYCTSVLFIQGRLTFYKPDGSEGAGNSGAPSMLIAYGKECSEILKNCGIKGKFIQLK